MPTLPKIDIKAIDTTKPLNAAAGVADLAYETAKSYAADVQKKVEGYRAEATTKLTEAKTKVTAFDPKTVPAKAKESYAGFPEKVKTAAKSRYESTSTTATGTYDKLATRGEAFVAKFKKTETPAETPAEETPEA